MNKVSLIYGLNSSKNCFNEVVQDLGALLRQNDDINDNDFNLLLAERRWKK